MINDTEDNRPLINVIAEDFPIYKIQPKTFDLIFSSIPTHDEELKRLLKFIPKEFYKEEGSIFYDVLSIVAADNIKNLKIMKEIFENSFGLTAKGQYLDFKVSEVGMSRKEGEKAKGQVKFKGTQGVLIPFNTVVLCDNLEYLTLTDGIIRENGELTLEIVAKEIGKKYNVKERMINKIGTTISGVNSVINEYEIVGGVDIEKDSELRDRYLQKVREPATSGNAYDYKRWATSVNGIGGAKVYPLHNGAGTVKVLIISSLGGTVDEKKLEEVKEVIENLKPIGATVTVENAIPLNINISATITKNSLIDIDTIKNEFKEKVSTYLTEINLNNGSVSFGRISAILYNLKGLVDFNNLRINGESNSVDIQDTNIAVLGTVELNV